MASRGIKRTHFPSGGCIKKPPPFAIVLSLGSPKIVFSKNETSQLDPKGYLTVEKWWPFSLSWCNTAQHIYKYHYRSCIYTLCLYTLWLGYGSKTKPLQTTVFLHFSHQQWLSLRTLSWPAAHDIYRGANKVAPRRLPKKTPKKLSTDKTNYFPKKNKQFATKTKCHLKNKN